MNQRALVYFEERSHRPEVSKEEILYNRRAILAIKKLVPMPVTHERTFWHYRHYCPDCAMALPRENLRHCDNCGQALDWSNYEEGLKYVR